MIKLCMTGLLCVFIRKYDFERLYDDKRSCEKVESFTEAVTNSLPEKANPGCGYRWDKLSAPKQCDSPGVWLLFCFGRGTC